MIASTMPLQFVIIFWKYTQNGCEFEWEEMWLSAKSLYANEHRVYWCAMSPKKQQQTTTTTTNQQPLNTANLMNGIANLNMC